MGYHTTYRKMSARKMIRTVNVKGDSTVKGGKCTMEKMSPRPRTVTVQSLAIGALVRENGLDFIFFFIIDDVRRWQREGGTIGFSGVIRR